MPQGSDLGPMQIQAMIGNVKQTCPGISPSDIVYIDKDCLANNVPHN